MQDERPGPVGQPAPLGDDDYSQLLSLGQNGDPRYKAILKRLTPDETTAFNAWLDKSHGFNRQTGEGNPELTRQDNTLFGLPPELAAVGMGKLPSIAKDAVVSIGPELKNAARLAAWGLGFKAIGLPPWMAMVLSKRGMAPGSMIGTEIADEAGTAAEKAVAGGEGEAGSVFLKRGGPPNLMRGNSETGISRMRTPGGQTVGGVDVELPSTQPRTPEFPPGTNRRTPPSIFEQKSKDFAEGQENPAETMRVRRRIAKELDKKK